MKYEIKYPIHNDALITLYNAVGWTGYTDFPQKIASMLKHSLWWCACWDNENLIGLIRVVGDGVSIVYIQDLLVHPDYQRKGIGSHLMNKALDTFKDIRQCLLITENDPKNLAFYKSMGMEELSETNGVGFIRYNFNV